MMYRLVSWRFFGGSLIQQAVRFIDRISSIPLLVLLIFLSALFPTVLFPAHGIVNIRPLDLHFSYSPDQVYEHLAVLGADGRSAYTSMALTSDLVFPVVYSFALSVMLMLVFRKLFPPTSRFRHLCLFPFLIVIIDWCENLSLVFITNAYPERTDLIVNFASSLTSLKLTLIVSTALMLLAAVTFWAISGLRGK